MTVAQDAPHPPKQEYPRFEDVTEGFETIQGLFPVYRKKNQLLMEILGPVSYLEPDAPGAVLKSRIQAGTRGSIILTFGGGVNEMQRDLISQFTLGLPRADR